MEDLIYRGFMSLFCAHRKFRHYDWKSSDEVLRDLGLKHPLVLDVGCYTADLLKFLPPSVDYYGIDNDENALEIVKKRGAKVIKLDLENEEITIDQEFDISFLP